MRAQRFAIGTEIACPLPNTSENFTQPSTPPSTVQELLDIIVTHGDKNLPMLRTTSVRLSEFLDTPVTELTIDVLVDVRSKFSDYLSQRRYKQNSIRTYRQNTQRLIRWAEQLGWVSNKASVEAAWRPFLDALAGNPRAYTTVIYHAIRNRRFPSEFTSADIDDWGETMLQAGRQYRSVRQGKWNFRKALADAGLDCLLPKLKPAPKKSAYRVPVNELPEPLASELKEILRWKQAKFAKGRPQWYRLRAISARILESNLCRLFGFAKNIAGFVGVTSMETLFTEEILSAFVEWALNERGITRESIRKMSMIHIALRYHPDHKDRVYDWFPRLFQEIPEDDHSRAQETKAKKSVPFEELSKIPTAIRAERMKLDQGSIAASRLAHDEFLMLWATTLPWRQRNIRECRLGQPETDNLFFAPLPSLIHIARPAWVDEALKEDPKRCFWQFYFREHETKMGHKARGIVPRRLIPLLQEYLQVHRPRLIAKTDPGTLFVNYDGNAVERQIMTGRISEIVLKYAGRRMTPHLFRDAFAYAYLDAHPEDYLTLSKILWHGNIRYTLSVYGRNYDESNGARRVDEWLGAAA